MRPTPKLNSGRALISDHQLPRTDRLDDHASGEILARNTAFNLVGQIAPMAVAVFTIPMLIRGLGTDRFGVLTIAWMLIGYFNLFDLGLGRALTKLVAEKVGTGKTQDIPRLAWTSLIMMATLGMLGALVFSLASPWLVSSALKIPRVIQADTLLSFYLLAVSLPVVITTAGFRGILEAQQCFGQINAVRVPMAVFTYIGPLVVLPFFNDLSHVIALLVIGRIIMWLVFLWLCARIFPGFVSGFAIDRAVVKPLLNLGGWFTLSNIIGPLMLYLDRLVIGGIISVAAVAYYTTPFEIVARLLIISGAVVGVMFPAFSATFAINSQHTALLYRRTIKYLFFLLFPATLIIVCFAKQGLLIWLGSEFAQNGFRAMQILTLGVFMLSLESVPFVLLQAGGRPDIPAKLNLLELPFYLAILWWLTSRYGIYGTAVAWLLRAIIDTLALVVFAGRLLPRQSYNFPRMATIAILVILSIGLSIVELPIQIKIAWVSAILFGFLWLSWAFLMDRKERNFVLNKFGFSEY